MSLKIWLRKGLRHHISRRHKDDLDWRLGTQSTVQTNMVNFFTASWFVLLQSFPLITQVGLEHSLANDSPELPTAYIYLRNAGVKGL